MQINCPVMKQNKDSYQGVLDWAKSLKPAAILCSLAALMVPARIYNAGWSFLKLKTL